MPKKVLMVSCIIFSLCFSIAYCKDVVTLKMWDVPRPWQIQERAVFEHFLKIHPDINIVQSSGIQITGAAQESGFLMAMAGGTAPDLFEVNFRGLKLYMSQGFLYPLDEYFEKDKELFLPYMPEKFKPIYYDKRGGHIYGVPVSFIEMFGIYYRKDMFKKAGLNPNRPPKNWDELFEYALKLTDQEKGQYGLALSTGIWGGWLIDNFVWQAGGEMAREYKECSKCKELIKAIEGKTEEGWQIYPDKCTNCNEDLTKVNKYVWRVAFNEAPGVTALEFWKKLRWYKYTKNGKEYKGVARVYADYSPAYSDFTLGKIAMIFAYSSEDFISWRGGFSPAEVGVAVLPAGPTGIKANFMQTNTWSINAQIKDKRIRDAAWDYIKFQATDEAKKIRIKSIVEQGFAQYTNPLLLKKFGYDEYLDQIPPEWIETYEEQIKVGRPEPYAPGFKSVAVVEIPVAIDQVLTEDNTNVQKVLDLAAERSNKTLLGLKDEKEMQKKRKIALAILILVIILLSVVVFFIGKNLLGVFTMEKEQAKLLKERKGRESFRRQFNAWIFMLPALITILVWQYYPLFKGVQLAFLDYKIIGASKFLGLDNFIEVFSSKIFWLSLKNTLIYVGITIGCGFWLPIVVALFLSEVPKGKYLFRTLFYTPAVTTSLVLLILWMMFYDPSPVGLFNKILSVFGIKEQRWLQDSQLAMFCIILPGIWASAGPSSVIYLAALSGIPEELYEAADVDGASTWQKIWSITIPQIKPLIIINFVGAFIGAFHGMGNILVMTGGGPNYATHVLSLEIWMDAFLFLRFGYATAVAWIVGIMLIGFTIYQLRILRRVQFKVAE